MLGLFLSFGLPASGDTFQDDYESGLDKYGQMSITEKSPNNLISNRFNPRFQYIWAIILPFLFSDIFIVKIKPVGL